MASKIDPSTSEAAVRKQNNGPPFKFLFPLVYAPVLPLIRIALRKNPVLRDRLFMGVLAGAFAHGSYLVQIWMMGLLVGFVSVLTEGKLSDSGIGFSADLYDIESK